MAVNKVVWAAKVLIDLTGDTVTPETLAEGVIAHDASGNRIVGTLKIKPAFTNLVPTSTDTDGSIYNGVGYKDNTRLSSSGGVSSSAQAGSVTTGFIPFGGATDIIRMKGVEWVNATENIGGHYYINFYDINKKFKYYFSAAEYPTETHIITVTRDANGVETVVFNNEYGTSNVKLQFVRNDAAFVRINAYGKGADMIVTVNEEIT